MPEVLGKFYRNNKDFIKTPYLKAENYRVKKYRELFKAI